MSSNAIAIVRHGETDWNRARRIQGRTEVPLNDTGRAQARETGLLLTSPELRDVHGEWRGLRSSPLGRAVETAEIMAETLGLDAPRIEQALYERDFGPAEGLAVTEAQERWPGLVIPGAESLESLAERTAETFDRVLFDAPGTVVVAHGAMIRAGLSRLSGQELPRILNGEIWLFTREGAGPRVARFGGPPAS